MTRNIGIVNPLEPFKFWASKPLSAALAYLEKYGNNKRVLFDPFAGSGVFVYAGILRGMKTIYNDLCPYALFLARNAIKPFDPSVLQESFNEVLKTTLVDDIKTKKGKIIIPKGTIIEEAVKWFYKSSCNEYVKTKGKVCNQEVVVEYFIWDTEYYITKKEGDKYANDKLLEGDKRYKIFLDVICHLGKTKLPDGKKVISYIFNRRTINEKWKEAFDTDPNAWLKQSERQKYEPAVVNEVAANLIRLNIAHRYRRYPLLKKIRCPIHGEKQQSLSNTDLRKLKEIESLSYPFPKLIPNCELIYRFNGIWKPFTQYREHQTFVEEGLSTFEAKDWTERIPKLKHYFTKRNLIALSLILWSMMKTKDLDLRDQLYLILVSNLHMTAKFDRSGNYGRWATGYYASLDDFKENNVLDQLTKGWTEVKKVKQIIWDAFNSSLGSIYYDETWDVKDFLKALNEPGKKNVLWLRQDARKLYSTIGRCIIDLVFTDPPYRGGEFSVQYFELTTFYVGWLSLDKEWAERYGDLSWWKDEIIENDMQEKNLEKYFDLLREAFAAINHITKRDGIWIITYHSPSKDVWEGIKNILESFSLKVPTYDEILTHKIRAKGKGSYYVTRYGSIGEDAYIVLAKEEEKEVETLKPVKEIDVTTFLSLVLQKMKDEIVGNSGVITWDMFTKHFPDIVIKHGGPYGETKSYKELFENITIELADESRMLDRDKVGDELYYSIYSEIEPKTLVHKALTLYGSKRKEIPRAELDLKVLPKINSRVSDVLKIGILEELFKYDPIGNKYIFKKKEETLEKYIPKTEEKAPKLPIPPELIYQIEDNAKKYGAHKVGKVTKDFSSMIHAREQIYLININDESGLRRFIAGTTEKERINKIIVFLHYGSREKELKKLAKILKPAILVGIPYQKWEEVVNSFRNYEPINTLKEFVIEGE